VWKLKAAMSVAPLKTGVYKNAKRKAASQGGSKRRHGPVEGGGKRGVNQAGLQRSPQVDKMTENLASMYKGAVQSNCWFHDAKEKRQVNGKKALDKP